MEEISLALFLLGLLAYLVSEDYVGHLLGANFINSGVLFFLISLSNKEAFAISSREIFFIYVALNLLLISGMFVIKKKPTQEKIDEISE